MQVASSAKALLLCVRKRRAFEQPWGHSSGTWEEGDVSPYPIPPQGCLCAAPAVCNAHSRITGHGLLIRRASDRVYYVPGLVRETQHLSVKNLNQPDSPRAMTGNRWADQAGTGDAMKGLSFLSSSPEYVCNYHESADSEPELCASSQERQCCRVTIMVSVPPLHGRGGERHL